MPYHVSARPGNRVLDAFPTAIDVDSYSPKKGSSLFKAWLRDFANSISLLHLSGRPVIYTDGAYWNKSARGAFSFTCFHQGVWTDKTGWCLAGSSFDAEIVAIFFFFFFLK